MYVIRSAILVNLVKINKTTYFYNNNNKILGKTFVYSNYILINKLNITHIDCYQLWVFYLLPDSIA